ncbi:alpha/beta fold hydrolase [Mycetocola reblochoni]|uniref:Hydrolase n=2 Tax=Mycetocola reblochoni TaxID=331618 RepID=A0A1R4J5C4_9MICO|nr:alpha/beta hydrolase [Mycetocola reblochoni]RLP69578.1 alpha/beta hydrolase [Mycetocola reblochoni]SJN27331.1 Hydrolase [Mycetocola reblochoni REB411]
MSSSTPPAPVRRLWDVDGEAFPAWHYGDPEGRALILVHGFRGDHHGLELIAEQLGGRNVIVPDLPGFGEAPPLHREHSVEAYAEWLVGFHAAVDPEGDSDVLGHSFGSIIVSAAIAKGLAPRRTVLVNPIASPALSGPRSVLTALAVAYYRVGAALPARAGNAILSSPIIVRVMSEVMAKTPDRELRRWINEQHAAHFSAFATRDVVLEAFRASVSRTCLDDATANHTPTLLIAAEKDDISTVEDQRVLQRSIPDARLEVIPGVGHLIHYEAPTTAAALIEAFLSSPL